MNYQHAKTVCVVYSVQLTLLKKKVKCANVTAKQACKRSLTMLQHQHYLKLQIPFQWLM